MGMPACIEVIQLFATLAITEQMDHAINLTGSNTGHKSPGQGQSPNAQGMYCWLC